ncbi:MAG: TetR/AcrR family transcriptional regulator [Intestinibacter sp.]
MARPVKKQPEQWEHEILNVAQELFTTKGYEETSVSDIMNTVGGAKGMFYRSFKSKEELLNALVEKWAEQYLEAITITLCKANSTFSQKFISILSIVKEMSLKTVGLENFFTSSNQVMVNKLTERMTVKLVPLLSDTLKSGIDEGILSIENTDFYANYIIYGSLGALNYGNGSPKENITINLDYLPQIIANTLDIDVAVLTNGKFENGGEIK